mmetsp:Transcript_5379/g.11716  ORF Transcript_5379/g.11716 Transcript_5379/m.11716 type:complete len:758 (-) Transcript_5379:48-2321(-)
MANNGAERQICSSTQPNHTSQISLRYPRDHGSVMFVLVVLLALGNPSDAFSTGNFGGAVSVTGRFGINSKIGYRAYSSFSGTSERTSSFMASGRLHTSTERQLERVDNDEGKVRKLPKGGGNSPPVGKNKSAEYLYNITGTDEDRAQELNKAKLREAVNEVKGAAKVVKEKTVKLKDEVLKEQIKSSVDSSNSTATGKRESKKVEKVAEVLSEVTDSTAKLGGTVIKKSPSILMRLCLLLVSPEMRRDLNRRRPHYISDWKDGIKDKRHSIPAILFLYFACLSPAVSFGTISDQLTNGSIGVVEFLLSSGASGMVYSILCGQPMAFIAPTGLTLAFISGLYRLCTLRNIPFFPVYAWVGIWTSVFMIGLGMAGSSRLIRYCTRFTDEVFNGLLSLNFIYEAAASLRRNFINAPDPSNLTMPFVALSEALLTFFATTKVIAFQTGKYFNQKARDTVKNFGPVGVIVAMSLINQLPLINRFKVPTLSVAKTFELAGGRDFLIPLTSIPVKARLLCALPAVLLTSLFFMDQNISVRVVNNPDNKLKKGPAYNIDMVALGLITGALSVVGLPWMCGATVQSMNHLKAMTTTRFNEETQEPEIDHVTETRLTGFVIHALIAATVTALPLLQYLPIPVVSGVFLYLGRKLMSGNSFIERMGDGLAERRRLPKKHPIHLLGRKKMNMFTFLQATCLIGLWTFKQNPATAIFFPSVIGMLIAIRALALPRFFSEEELVALGDPTPKRSKTAQLMEEKQAVEASPS